jgi:hypothetical protein
VAAGPRITYFWADVVEIQRKKRWATMKFCAKIKEDRIWVADMALKFYSRFLIQIKEFFKHFQTEYKIGQNQINFLGTFQIWKLKLGLNIQI